MKLLRTLPASTLQSIAHALRGSRLKPPYTAFTVAEWAPQYDRDSLASELVSLECLKGKSGYAFCSPSGGALRAASITPIFACTQVRY